MIELTIKLDTDKVEAAIRDAWQREFRPPESGSYRQDQGGSGWCEVVRQIKKHVETLDLSSEITRIAKAKLADVVDEAVTQVLREKVKQRAKEMMRDGTLLT